MSLLVSFIISTIGLAYFIYGKKTYDIIIMLVGACLMIFPYFVKNTVAVIVIGIVLLILPLIKKHYWR